MKKISVSTLSSNNVEKDLNRINFSNADYIHVDVADGKFVNNKNNPFKLLKKMSSNLKKRLDVHLMDYRPKKNINRYAALNAEYITIHVEVGEISLALGRGKHTTRVVELLSILGGKLVDTPGFSSIDLSVYTKEQIKDAFIEFSNNCKYNDCGHINEDSSICDVKRRVENNEILKSRYDNYVYFIGGVGK